MLPNMFPHRNFKSTWTKACFNSNKGKEEEKINFLEVAFYTFHK